MRGCGRDQHAGEHGPVARCRPTTTTRTAPAPGRRTSSSATPTTSTSRARSPTDLDGVYLRNTENPVHPSIGLYHPFDGDGMLHAIRFDGRRGALPQPLRPHRRLPRRAGGRPSRCGPACSTLPEHSLREDGWGARGRMKDASSTDVVVHDGTALTHLLPVRRRLPARPDDARRRGQGAVGGRLPEPDRRVGAPEARRAHRRAARLRLRQGARRTCTTAWSSADGRARALDRRAAARARACRTTWRSPSTTRSSTTCPLFWEPELLEQGVHLPALLPGPAQPVRRSSRAAAAPTRSAGSRPSRPTSCTGSTRTRTATRSCSTASSSTTRRRRSGDGAPRMVVAYRHIDLAAARRPAAPLALRPRDRARRRRSRCRTGPWSSG